MTFLSLYSPCTDPPQNPCSGAGKMTAIVLNISNFAIWNVALSFYFLEISNKKSLRAFRFLPENMGSHFSLKEMVILMGSLYFLYINILKKNLYAKIYQLESTRNRQFLWCPLDIFSITAWVKTAVRSKQFSAIISGNEILSSMRIGRLIWPHLKVIMIFSIWMTWN